MKVFGLTGGIGSGKSSVAEMLAARGCAVVSLDEVAKEVLAPGSDAVAEVAATWPSVVRDGMIVRSELANVAFADPRELARLNAIVHPRAWALSDEYVRQFGARGVSAVVVESALLRGSVKERAYDANIVVVADDDVRVVRLVTHRGFDPVDARARIAQQMAQEELMSIADYVIDNSGSREHLEHLVDEMWVRWLEPLVNSSL